MKKLSFLMLLIFVLVSLSAGAEEPTWPDRKGEYINIKFSGDYSKIFQFHFTNDFDHENFNMDSNNFNREPGDPYFLVSTNEAAGDGWNVYLAEKGTIIDGSGNLDEHINRDVGGADDNGCFSAPVQAVGGGCSQNTDGLTYKDFTSGDGITNKCGDDESVVGANPGKSCTLNYDSGDSGNNDGEGGFFCSSCDGDKDDSGGIYQSYTLFGQSEIIVAAPKDEIIWKNPQNHGGGTKYSKYDFFLCDSSGNYNDGKVVYAPDADKNSGEVRGWKCSGDGEWKKLHECNDGISNYDGDDFIDHDDSEQRPAGVTSDPQCTSTTDDTGEDNSPDCKPAIEYDGSDDTYYANYGGAPTGDEDLCDGSGGNQESFADWTQSLGLPAGQVPDPFDGTCSNESQSERGCASTYRSYNRHDETPNTPDEATVSKVQYYPTQTYLDALGLSSGDKTTSDFVNGEVGWRGPTMGLDASSSTGIDGLDTIVEGAEWKYASDDTGTLQSRHSNHFWFNTKGLAQGSDPDYEGHQSQSWDVANAGVNDPDGDGDFEIASTNQHPFPGGWYGKCSGDNQWHYDDSARGDWTCADEVNTQATITVNLYGIGDVGGKYAGFQINGTELQKWEDVYGVSPISSNAVNNLQVRAQCWEGQLNNRPSDLSNVVNISNRASGSPGNVDTLYALGELPDRSSSVNDEDSYSCIWGFQQRFTDPDAVPAMMKGTDGDIYHIDSSSGTLEKGFGTDPSIGEYGYAISGTNTEGPIYTDVEGIESPGQQTLENRASSSFNPTTPLWQYFPKGGLEPSAVVRHPGEAWDSHYGN